MPGVVQEVGAIKPLQQKHRKKFFLRPHGDHQALA